MKRTTTAIAVAAALGLGLLAAGSLQAYGPGGGRGAGMMMHPAAVAGYGPGQGLGRGPCGAGAIRDLVAVKTTLGIAADQESAWQQYVDAVDTRRAMRAEHRREIAETARESRLTPPERLDLRARFMEDRLEVQQTYADAVKALYSVLTPEQQARANRVLRHGRML